MGSAVFVRFGRALEAQGLLQQVKAGAELMGTLYREEKDLTGSIAVGCATLGLGLSGDAEVRSAAKAVAYNLAANSWRGWDEPGIHPSPADERIGLLAAELNLALAAELQKPPIALARAHWLRGALRMSAEDWDGAASDFDEAARLAGEAGETGEATLSQAFAALSRHQPAAVRAALAELEPNDPDRFFRGQVEVAARVFGLPTSP